MLGVRWRWICLTYALGLLLGLSIANGATKDAGAGCLLMLVSDPQTNAPVRLTLVWVRYPNVPESRWYLQNRKESEAKKALEDCEKWIDRKMKIMPIPLTTRKDKELTYANDF